MHRPKPKYELQPVDVLDPIEIDVIAADINRAVSTPEVTKLLIARHMLGVLARHSATANESARSLLKAQAEMSNSRQQQTFVVRQNFGRDTGRVVGMATSIPGLDLRRQRIPLAPAAVRRIPFLSRQVDLGQDMVNVSGWTTHTEGDKMRHALGEIYTQIQDVHDGLHWTLEPYGMSRREGYYTAEGMIRAGLGHYGIGYYDDLEAGRHQPMLPTMELFTDINS